MQGVCNFGKVLNEVSTVSHDPMKPLMAVYIVGLGYLVMAFRLSLLGLTPFDETLCPKYSIFSLKNSHFLGLSFSLWSLKHSRTARKHSMCSSCVLE